MKRYIILPVSSHQDCDGDDADDDRPKYPCMLCYLMSLRLDFVELESALSLWLALSHERSFNEDCNKIIDNRLITVKLKLWQSGRYWDQMRGNSDMVRPVLGSVFCLEQS